MKDQGESLELRSASDMGDLVPQPTSFKITSVRGSDYLIASDSQNEVQKHMYRHEPPVHSTQALQELFKSVVDLTIENKSFGKMRIHDACTAFVLQSFLISLTYHGIKGIDIRPL